MKRFQLPVMLLAVHLLTSTSLGIAQPRVDTEPQYDPNWKFDIINAPSLEGNFLGDEAKRLIEVYLPPSYHTSRKRYPVVYYLWGFNSQNKKNDMKVKEHKGLIDEKIRNNMLGEMVVVFISGSNRLRGSFYVNSPVTGKWADFILNDVVGYVDKTYRTLANREFRSIVGSSMGGYGALTLSMLHPDIFSSGYGLSPATFTGEGFNFHGMVKSEGGVEKTIRLIKRLHALPLDEARREYFSLVDSNTDRWLISTLAYGAAHAPDAERPPYFKYPFRKVGEKIVVDQDIWRLWQNGFGGIGEEIKTYKSNLEKLKVYGLSVGYNEQYRWLYDGCLYFSDQLEANRINHILHLHHGTHTSLTTEVLIDHVLPLLSNVMTHQ